MGTLQCKMDVTAYVLLAHKGNDTGLEQFLLNIVVYTGEDYSPTLAVRCIDEDFKVVKSCGIDEGYKKRTRNSFN